MVFAFDPAYFAGVAVHLQDEGLGIGVVFCVGIGLAVGGGDGIGIGVVQNLIEGRAAVDHDLTGGAAGIVQQPR